MKRLGDLPG